MPMVNIQFEVDQDIEIGEETIDEALKDYLGERFDTLQDVQACIDSLTYQLHEARREHAAERDAMLGAADLIHEQNRASIDELNDFTRALLNSLDKTRTELREAQRREQYRDAQIAELFRLTTPWWKRLFGG